MARITLKASKPPAASSAEPKAASSRAKRAQLRNERHKPAPAPAVPAAAASGGAPAFEERSPSQRTHARVHAGKPPRADARGAPPAPQDAAPGAPAAKLSRVTILLHKPMGYVSGQAEDGHQPAVVLINGQNRWRGDRARTRFAPASCAAWRRRGGSTSIPPACWC
jgi:23S rRNA pseudouridine2604 synthase